MAATMTLTMMIPLAMTMMMTTAITTNDDGHDGQFLDVSKPQPKSSSQLQDYKRNNTQIKTLKF
jgi:hypothetical protein